MDDSLLFIQTPRIVIATNTFLCRIPIRYKDSPVLEIVKEVTTHKADTFTTKIPIFHSDGTKLAVVKGRQIYLTEDGNEGRGNTTKPSRWNGLRNQQESRL